MKESRRSKLLTSLRDSLVGYEDPHAMKVSLAGEVE